MSAPMKLRLPPGFYRNGTEYMAAGRYMDGNLIRWHGDVIKPINGWTRRYDMALSADMAPLWTDGFATEAARSGTSITDTTSGIDVYIGTNKKIYRVTDSNKISNVTPTGFIAQDKNASSATGYGIYRYSFGQYGTPRPAISNNLLNVFSWGFSEWGLWPVAVARNVSGNKVYLKKDTDARFVPIANSPDGVSDVIVTDERIMMVIGTPTDFRLVQWSDQEDYDQWAPAVDNQAGSYRLAGTGKLVCIVRVLNQNLILGENDAFSAQYIGPPYVYGFQRVGDKCGIIGAEAIAVTDTFAIWIGGKSFWLFDGTVRQLPCDVLDFYLEDKNESQRSKTMAFTISDYSEVWFLYQSRTSPTNEPDSYIIYNYAKGVWYTGRISRTLGLDNDPLTHPLMVDPSGKVYDHEIVNAGRDNSVPWIQTGPLELNNGERLLACSYVYPDYHLSGDVRMELSVRDMPNQPARFTRDFELIDPTSTVGIMGRDLRMKLYGALVNPNWTVGDFRVVPTSRAGSQR